MNNIKIKLWGREFNLDIIYDCYSNEKVLESQEKAAQSFPGMSDEIESSLEHIKAYCLSNNKGEIGAESIDNIFKYVAPKYLFIPRDEKNQVVALMCNYKFDPESGIAVVFENGKLIKIGKQEIIL
ncbi:MAG: DUF6985 domain-containing protein [Marvinbryantia sp.]|jgi:hypothetical protein